MLGRLTRTHWLIPTHWLSPTNADAKTKFTCIEYIIKSSLFYTKLQNYWNERAIFFNIFHAIEFLKTKNDPTNKKRNQTERHRKEKVPTKALVSSDILG